jgi:glutamate formiminotransferase
MADLYQCTPNFSEGRDRTRLEQIVESGRAAAAPLQGEVRDWSYDGDHNRSVVTFLGSASAMEAAALATASAAMHLLDLRSHEGVHPRTGVLDVLPFTPLRDAGPNDAVELAHRVGSRLAHELELAVNYYGWAARPGRPESLPLLRKLIIDAQEPLAPDDGPLPTAWAGRVLVSARGPLVACNMNIAGTEQSGLHRIVRRLRRDRDTVSDLAGVRALALYLPHRDTWQVSMNLTRPHDMTLPALFAYLNRCAAEEGAAVVETEIIGVIPESTLNGAAHQDIRWANFNERQVLRGF